MALTKKYTTCSRDPDTTRYKVVNYILDRQVMSYGPEWEQKLTLYSQRWDRRWFRGLVLGALGVRSDVLSSKGVDHRVLFFAPTMTLAPVVLDKSLYPSPAFAVQAGI